MQLQDITSQFWENQAELWQRVTITLFLISWQNQSLIWERVHDEELILGWTVSLRRVCCWRIWYFLQVWWCFSLSAGDPDDWEDSASVTRYSRVTQKSHYHVQLRTKASRPIVSAHICVNAAHLKSNIQSYERLEVTPHEAPGLTCARVTNTNRAQWERQPRSCQRSVYGQ